MKYYYADADSKPVGPFDLSEIAALAANGKIASDPMVQAEGSAHWVPLSSLNASAAAPGGASSAAERPKLAEKLKSVNSSLLSDFVSKILSICRKILPASFIGYVLGKARDIGHYVVLATAVLVVIYTLFAAIKFNTFSFLPMGLALLALLTIAQFAAQSFLGAGERLIANSSSRIATPAFLECFGMLALSVAAIALCGGIFTAIQSSSISPLLLALLVTAIFTFVGAQMLHPHLVNVEIGDASAGEEAIGLLTLALKIGLKLVPLAFFLVAALGAIAIILAFGNGGREIAALAPFVPYGMPTGFAGAALVITACLLPMIAYLVFLIFYLSFDLIRAVLSIPGKLDALRR